MNALDELKEAAANDAALRSEFKKLIEDLMAENARLWRANEELRKMNTEKADVIAKVRAAIEQR